MDRRSLIDLLRVYDSGFDVEKIYAAQLLDLLQHPRAFQRDHLPGHITGSSWIVDHSRNFVLLVHHGTLNKWLQPGGHADGEEDVLNVALREAEEETGLREFKILKQNIFDIDIHPIPERAGFPDHLHYDIRFLFEADKNHKIIISEESHDVAWVEASKLQELTDGNLSIMRMVEKVRWFKV